MIRTTAGFVVYGVHKDGLRDPSGQPFIDEAVIASSKKALEEHGLGLKCADVVVATKQEAREVIGAMAKDDEVDALILFSGTWVWSAHMVAAIREFAKTGKAVVLWTHDGSQGWRPVGGLVLSAGLNEIGIRHTFVYGGISNPKNVEKVVNTCVASALRRQLEMTTLMVFGGRGMGQTCGVCDPSQWMRMFGIDIDSRDTYELVKTADSFSTGQVQDACAELQKRVGPAIEFTDANERSVRLYLALRELKRRYEFDYYTIQSFPGLGDYYAATCFAQSMMLDDRIPTSTLSDFNTALTTILLTRLSSEPVYYGDLQHIDMETREIKIIGDGAVPPSLADSHGVQFAEHGIPTEGEAGGLSISLTCKPGPGVLARISRVCGVMQMTVARCEVFVPDDSVLEKRRQECGIPFWPHAFVHVDADMEAFVQTWNNEYACLGYGEQLYDQLRFFCEQTGIEVLLP